VPKDTYFWELNLIPKKKAAIFFTPM